MTDLAKYSFRIEQLHPGSGAHRLNTCANPDCSNFGAPLTTRAGRRSAWAERRPDLTAAELDLLARHGPGAYKLAGADRHHRRVSRVFEHESDPHEWVDQRTIRCLGQTRDGQVCNSAFSLLSEDHLADEIARLRNHDGVLDGPACGACGTRFLARPDEFTFKGAHQRARDGGGRAAGPGAPRAVRVLHRPCKGRRGARITISLPHGRQKTTTDNLRILHALLNSAGILDVQRMIGQASSGRGIGVSRIYDRIAWLEQVFLAYEREMLRRWRAKVGRAGGPVEHRLSHDDLVLSVNWESSDDRRVTQLSCAVTADASSGYVYRLDVDFDPRVTPVELFNATYLDEHGEPRNLSREYPGTKFGSAPLFSWQRPTGRLHEPHFFAACVGELRTFRERARRRMPRGTDTERAARDEVLARADHSIDAVRKIGEGWFGMRLDACESRGSSKGCTTRDLYTKAAHFALLREMLPEGRIVLTTEQEAILPAVLPHVFDEEIRADRFTWLAMSFRKNATKPEILRSVKRYRTERRQFHNDGMYEGRFDEDTDAGTVTRAFIRDHMKAALRDGDRPFPISNFQVPSFPLLWLRAPTQASGEIDKTVGFPVVPGHIRGALKRTPFDADPAGLDEELRDELADLVWKATLQPVSTFMNSVRERLSAATRAGRGGARVGGSYVQGAVFNPRTLIALLNIFRVHYNFFEARPYASPFDDGDPAGEAPKVTRRALRIPGTAETVELVPRVRRAPERLTPAMRHGMDAFRRTRAGAVEVPDLHRLLYRPWLYMGTRVGARLDRSWSGRSSTDGSCLSASPDLAAE